MPTGASIARPIAARMSQTLGQQVLVENQGGAGGTVGAANVVKRAYREIVERFRKAAVTDVIEPARPSVAG